ncbi:MAG: DNA (cytosine-5-)-methyltransferase, partial [Bauldia litoralis]
MFAAGLLRHQREVEAGGKNVLKPAGRAIHHPHSYFVLALCVKPWQSDKKIPSSERGMLQANQSEFARLRQQVGVSIEDLAPEIGFSISTLYRWERGQSQPRKAALHVLQEMARANHPKVPAEPTFRFIDLFAGIGGLRRGFEPLGGECVFTSEWDRYAQATYRANFNCEHELAGDIRQVKEDDIPEHDVLLAGFPCQPFSIAGVSKKNALRMPHGFLCETQG